ncbi:MAG: hypothetical protein FJ398_25100 [Verrucomicrobia bacterium]|nr:hypothetical protein [Verrucomicrobiota bacterium]
MTAAKGMLSMKVRNDGGTSDDTIAGTTGPWSSRRFIRACLRRYSRKIYMNTIMLFILGAAVLPCPSLAQDNSLKSDAGKVTLHSQGLHGYIGSGHEKLPANGGW